MATSNKILQSYLLDSFRKNKKLRVEDLLAHNVSFLTPLTYYQELVKNIDPVMIPYLHAAGDKMKEKREQLIQNLKITLVLLNAQKRYELAHQKTENQKKYAKQLQQCAFLLRALTQKKAEGKQFLSSPADTPCNYLAMFAGKEFAEKLVTLSDHKSKSLTGFLSAINEKRLYWVWGSVFIKTIISALPTDFYNTQQAGQIITTPDPYTGCLSWGLYYFRFAINLGLLLKHTFAGPWMKEAERKEITSTWNRFTTQFDQRKFILLNDSLWATANILCYFVLRGAAAPVGDALTVLLLVFDLSVAWWDFNEQQDTHENMSVQFRKDINALERELSTLEKKALATHDVQEKNVLQAQSRQLKIQLRTLEEAQKAEQTEWRFKKMSLWNNTIYAVSLLAAFVILAMPFIPVAASFSLPLMVLGAILCFAFSLISKGVGSYIELMKINEAKAQVQLTFAQLVADKPATIQEQKLLYLELKQAFAASEYQQKLAVYQTAKLIHTFIVEALVPAIILSTIIFLPLGIGFAALGGVLGLALGSRLLIDHVCKVDEKMKQLPTNINELEFARFDQFINNEQEKTVDTYARFFKNNVPVEIKNAQEVTPLEGIPVANKN